MKIPLESAIRLLHETAHGTLATNSQREPGYPFATVLPFAPDAAHMPLFLISALAEHTRNLLADPRVSFLVNHAPDGNVQTGTRLTLIGEVARIDADKATTARYLRYHPSTEQYLELGDFAFFRLQPKRLRYIGGFGQAGWIEGSEWQAAQTLEAEQEASLIKELETQFGGKPRVLGIDCYGFDYESGGKRERQNFPENAAGTSDLGIRVRRLLTALT